jgi:hypothetical protein
MSRYFQFLKPLLNITIKEHIITFIWNRHKKRARPLQEAGNNIGLLGIFVLDSSKHKFIK